MIWSLILRNSEFCTIGKCYKYTNEFDFHSFIHETKVRIGLNSQKILFNEMYFILNFGERREKILVNVPIILKGYIYLSFIWLSF